MLQTTYLIISQAMTKEIQLTQLVRLPARPLSLLPDSESRLPGLRTFDHSARSGFCPLS